MLQSDMRLVSAHRSIDVHGDLESHVRIHARLAIRRDLHGPISLRVPLLRSPQLSHSRVRKFLPKDPAKIRDPVLDKERRYSFARLNLNGTDCCGCVSEPQQRSFEVCCKIQSVQVEYKPHAASNAPFDKGFERRLRFFLRRHTGREKESSNILTSATNGNCF